MNNESFLSGFSFALQTLASIGVRYGDIDLIKALQETAKNGNETDKQQANIVLQKLKKQLGV